MTEKKLEFVLVARLLLLLGDCYLHKRTWNCPVACMSFEWCDMRSSSYYLMLHGMWRDPKFQKIELATAMV